MTRPILPPIQREAHERIVREAVARERREIHDLGRALAARLALDRSGQAKIGVELLLAEIEKRGAAAEETTCNSAS